MMKLIWYAFNPTEYNRDTAHLSMLEHGAYRLLLDHYYLTGFPLPAIAERLHRICRAFANAEQEAVQVVLQQFFELTPDGWKHDRVERELEKTRELSNKRKQAAASSHLKRKKEPEEIIASASASACASACASAGANGEQLPPQLQLHISTSQSYACAREAFQIRPDWKPSVHFPDITKQAGVTVTDAKIAEFVTYWLTQPHQRSQAEWDKALLQSLLRSKTVSASKPVRTPKSENFHERDYGKGIQPL